MSGLGVSKLLGDITNGSFAISSATSPLRRREWPLHIFHSHLQALSRTDNTEICPPKGKDAHKSSPLQNGPSCQI